MKFAYATTILRNAFLVLLGWGMAALPAVYAEPLLLEGQGAPSENYSNRDFGSKRAASPYGSHLVQPAGGKSQGGSVQQVVKVEPAIQKADRLADEIQAETNYITQAIDKEIPGSGTSGKKEVIPWLMSKWNAKRGLFLVRVMSDQNDTTPFRHDMLTHFQRWRDLVNQGEQALVEAENLKKAQPASTVSVETRNVLGKLRERIVTAQRTIPKGGIPILRASRSAGEAIQEGAVYSVEESGVTKKDGFQNRRYTNIANLAYFGKGTFLLDQRTLSFREYNHFITIIRRDANGNETVIKQIKGGNSTFVDEYNNWVDPF